MIKLYTVFAFCLIACLSLSAQSVEKDSLGFETFSYQKEDTTYLMKKYFLVLLKKGTASEVSPEETQKIQKGHMEHLNELAEMGCLDLAGPMGDDESLRGILVMRVPSLEKAKALVADDPAIKAGRLVAEIHPWWAAVGSSLK
jgi:uncharacterized protein YciI